MLLDAGATPRLVFEKAQNEYTALEAESKKLDLVSSSADERITSVQRELDAARKLLQGKSEDLETVTAHREPGKSCRLQPGLSYRARDNRETSFTRR